MLELIFVGYILVCGITLGIRHRRSRQDWWIRFVLAVSFPVAGLLLPVFWPKKWHERNAKRQQEQGLDIIKDSDMDSDSGSRLYQKPEADKEMNVIPIEEALLVNDHTTRRRIMIDLLRQDSLEYLEILRMAVSNEDSETSHYAVSAIMEIKRKLTISLQELAVKYEENRQDPHLLRSYADVLKAYMRSGFLDDRTMAKHLFTYSEVLRGYLELEQDSAVYEELIEAELELNDFNAAEKTAKRYLELFPGNEKAYISLIQVYYSVRSYSQLMQTIELVKQSPVRLTSRGLSVIRFWSERGERHELGRQIKT